MTIASMKRVLFLTGLLLLANVIQAQVFIGNPSFEGTRGQNTTPPPWSICSGTPDTPPVLAGGPVIGPSDGNSCLGMVNNIPGLLESVSQPLFYTLDTLSCYNFDIDLKYVPTYLQSCNPGRLRVWLGTSNCNKAYLAWTSPIITHGPWRTYSVFFTSPQAYTHITLDLIHTSSTPQNVCMGIDNIHNQIATNTSITQLGNDTSLCPGDTLILDATTPSATYQWQDNSTSATFTK